MWLKLGPQKCQRGHEFLPHGTDWGRLISTPKKTGGRSANTSQVTALSFQ